MTNQAINERQDFTQGKVFGKLIKFSLPIILTGLLQTLYNASDMIVVGRFYEDGTNAMGAVGSCNSLINLIIGLFMGLAVGAGVVSAQNIGAKRFDKLKNIIDTSFIFSLVSGIALGILGFICAGTLLSWMGTPVEVIGEATEYLKAYFVGVPAGLVYNFLSAILRSSGDTKRPLIFLTVSGLFNVILNLIMVIVFKMGAVGVGIATSASQYLSAIFILIYIVKGKSVCKLNFLNVTFSKGELKNIIRIGLPAGIQSVLFAISNVLIQSTINSYGNDVVNGSAAASNIEAFVYISMNAFYHSTLTFVGQNFGAGKIERIPKITLLASLAVSIVGIGLGALVVCFGDVFLSIYEPDSAVVRDWGIKRLNIIVPLYFLLGAMEVSAGTLRGMGKSVLAMIICLVGTCVFRIVWIYTICKIIPNNISVLFLSYPVSWFITLATNLLFFFVAYKKTTKRKLIN